MKTSTNQLKTLSNIILNYMLNPVVYHRPDNPDIIIRVEPLWATLRTDYENKKISLRAMIIEIDIYTGIHQQTSSSWFDLYSRGGNTLAICQLGDGSIKFKIPGDIRRALSQH